MSFGTESSASVGGQSLAGFIVSKATQSRKDARKEDRKQSRRKKKEEQTKKENKQQEKKQKIGTKLLGSLPSLGNLFSFKKPETKTSSQSSQPRSSGGATGLAKILTQGFGSLTADTMGVASGLASVTQVLNSSLRAQSFTATGVQTIASILSDQVENQGSILSTVKSLKTGGRSSGTGSSMFGSSRSSGVKSDTLTGFVWEKVKDKVLGFLSGAAATQLGKLKNLFKPKGATSTAKPSPSPGASALKPKPLGRMTGSYDRFLQGSSNFGDRLRLLRRGQIGPGQLFTKGGVDSLAKPTGGGLLKSFKSFATPKNLLTGVKGLGVGLLGDMAVNKIGEAVGNKVTEDSIRRISSLPPEKKEKAIKGLRSELEKEKSWQSGFGGAFDNIINLGGILGESSSQTKSGGIERILSGLGEEKMASGGVMLGEAGKESVVDLNSKTGKDLVGKQGEDPGMKASAASTLAVVDQFIKGMGSLGAPVAQALGPEIQNLARTFGMSQALPNLKVGGGKFKEDGGAKKTREDFLKNLIAGSLESLDAKKKEEKKQGQDNKPQTTNEQQNQSNPSNPDTGSGTQRNVGADGKPMDVHDPKSYGAGRQSVTKGTNEGVGVSDVDTNRQTGQLEANHVNFNHDGKDYKVRINPNNGDYEVFQSRGYLGMVDKKIDVGGPQGPKPGQANEALLRKAHGQVRAFFMKNAPQKGLSLKYLSEAEVDKSSTGNQKRGGTVKSYNKGGVVQKPWWDFIGNFIDTHRNTKSTDYKNQNNNPLASMAKQREMMKELGYEEGGTVKRPTIREDVDDIRRMIAASMMRQQDRYLPGDKIPVGNDLITKSVTPKVSPASPPTSATSKEGEGLNSAAIINIVGAGGAGMTIPSSADEMNEQSTAEFVSDPWPGGLASVLCVSSPWGN